MLIEIIKVAGKQANVLGRPFYRGLAGAGAIILVTDVKCTNNFGLSAETINRETSKAIEEKWAKHVYGTQKIPPAKASCGSEDSKKFAYILSMFPYPSGRLHFGHVRVYTMSDVVSRYHKLRGRQVLHPMGWDAFGLPAENAARDNGVDPALWTHENIATMKNQIIRMGCQFDWDVEICTCNPDYYRWTQWLFLKLFEKGLAYKKKAKVFWDPVDKTVLAEEQVDSDMRSWRSGAKVEIKYLSQWFIRTTEFAEQLAEGLNSPALRDGWRDIIAIQKHWIGPIRGYYSDCEVLLNGKVLDTNVRLWFQNPDTLKSASFVILSPEHHLVRDAANIAESYENGIQLLRFKFLNPSNGTLLTVFSGSPEALPGIPESSDCRTDEILNFQEFPEFEQDEQRLEIIRSLFLALKVDTLSTIDCKFIYKRASLKLRDWLISRQRKWGTPIPVLSCEDCGHATPVRESALPVTPQSSFVGMSCAHCSSANLKAETDTLDTFFDSSWYFFRYLDNRNDQAIFDTTKVQNKLPVTTYIGGKEHATLHLYFARFMTYFLESLKLSPVQEPFETLIPVGVVKGETYQLARSGKYVHKDQVVEEGKKLLDKTTKETVVKRWEKMSKSKLNGVDPEDLVRDYGIDIMRLLSMADVAPTSFRNWTPAQFPVYLNFQRKTWIVMHRFVKFKEDTSGMFEVIDTDDWATKEKEMGVIRNYYLKELLRNYEITSQLNVIVTRLQALFNEFLKLNQSDMRNGIQFERALGIGILGLYPIMPAYCAELWDRFRDVANFTENEFNLHEPVWMQAFPKIDQNYEMDLRAISARTGEVLVTAKVPYSQLHTLDAATALEIVYDGNDELEQYIPRDCCVGAVIRIEPNYRANLMLKSNKEVPLKPKAAERKKAKKESKG